MRKFFTFYLFFCLFFTPIIVFSTNSYAENNTKFLFLLKELGLGHLSFLNQQPISDIPQGRVIKCRVTDPEKLGVFRESEGVELKRIESNKWEIRNPDTGSSIAFTTTLKEGNIEVVKTASFIAPKQVVSSPSSQLDLQGRIGLGARASYVNYSDDDNILAGIKLDTEPDDAVMFDANINYFFNNYLSVEYSHGYVKTDVDLSASGANGNGGELKQTPILLTGRFSMPIKDRFVPYIGAGFGYIFNDFDQDDSLVESIYGPGADMDIDNNWVYHVNSGCDILFTPNFALNLDVKYIWNTVDIDMNLPGSKKEEFDMNLFVVGAGIKYYF
jgi:outer membrane protein